MRVSTSVTSWFPPFQVPSCIVIEIENVVVNEHTDGDGINLACYRTVLEFGAAYQPYASGVWASVAGEEGLIRANRKIRFINSKLSLTFGDAMVTISSSGPCVSANFSHCHVDTSVCRAG
jgi:hypothetical protein